jgi:large repetitive protein
MGRRRRFEAGTVTVLALLGVVIPVLISSEPAAALPAITVENSLTGDPASEWDVVGAGDPTLQGFTTEFSVDQGGLVEFKVGDPSAGTERDPGAPADFHIDIYRLGYYGGDGARKVATIASTETIESDPAPCLHDAATGLVDCGNWPVAASWSVPATATSGVYLGRLVREDTAGASHVTFVVRDDDGASDIVFQTADTTWQAYNRYGGNSLYQGTGPGTGGGADGRAYAVSYNRPLTTRGYASEDAVFNAEYPMIRWLERNGYDVSYIAGVDTARSGAELREHEVFVSAGHDEYWSGPQRANVEAARDAGVDLAFFSGNEVFWRTRWSPSIDGSATANRTLASYKETHGYPANADPTTEWTGTWRDVRPDAVALPENGLTGTIFTVNCCTYDLIVPADAGAMRLWRDTSVAASPGGDTLGSGILGYEWDEDLDNGARPAGQIRLSSTTVDVPQRVVESTYGSTFAPGTATHSLTLHRAASGALVFGAGTVQWSWGLDAVHDRGSQPAVPAVQQATVNLFADMGVQPSTLQGDLVAATASADTTAPSATITSPGNGSTVEAGTAVTVTGTASDVGGLVAGIEVSIDNGVTWHPARGTGSWSYTFTAPATIGTTVSISARATDDSVNTGTPAAPTVVTTATRSCPCSIFGETVPSPNSPANDSSGVELGLKFQATEPGFITGVRFYKFPQTTGTHVGRLWGAAGNKLAQVTFSGETASGWQEAVFDTPVAVAADTTYVVSYLAPDGFYAASTGALASSGVENPPLRAMVSGGSAGPAGNGVYKYANSCGDTVVGCFPDESFSSSNYWVDVVFSQSGVDDVAPSVLATAPADGASRVDPAGTVTATFDERMDVDSITTSTFTLTGSTGSIPASVTYDDGTRRATLTPSSPLADGTTYTATIEGRAGGALDRAGNALAADHVWTFTTVVDLEQGPGGPILVVGDATDPFGFYFAEVLRAEGLNEFATADITAVDATLLTAYDVVVLGRTSLTPTQVTALSDWVNGGGNLVAMRPDAQLAGLLGLTPGAGTLDEGYLRIDTASGPGVGLVAQTMQYHGTADLYTLDGATTVATLYSDATTPTTHPAVTVRSVGANGGQAASFTFDLARSVTATRQGNIAWAGINGDGTSGPVRTDDMFHNGTDPDWVDLDKVAIPQADEQQRLLANLIITGSLDEMPLPRMWYFPRGDRAVVVMTMDEHGGGDLRTRLNSHLAADPVGCSVADWECVRSTAYMYTNAPITNAEITSYQNQGFEFALHTDTGCSAFTPASLASAYASQIPALDAAFPALDPPRTNRTHCIAWSDWSSQPKTQLDNGIRLDTNYYYWPSAWLQNRPGMFTGSGIPMRFADVDGTMIDVYQAPTQMTDESGQSYPATIDALLSRATGPEGYYGAFVANAHTDGGGNADAMAGAIVASAQSRGVSVISAEQLLEWVDGRNSSSFENLTWNGTTLGFSITPAPGARGLTSMVPARTTAGSVVGLTLAGTPVTYELEVVKGVEYAVFAAAAGTYSVTYSPDATAPTVTATSPATGATGIAADTTVTATFSEAVQAATVDATTVTLAGPGGSVGATVTYLAGTATARLTPSAPLSPLTTYTATITGISDVAGNPMVAPYSWSFTTAAGPTCPCTIFDDAPGGSSFNDGQAIETGVKFRVDEDGAITAIRFHKSYTSGTQFTGHLWTASGTQIGTGTVTLAAGVTGWQEIPLSAPVAITRDTTYVASVLSPSGDYAGTVPGLVAGVDNPPVRALANGEDGPNGVYRYGGGFPTDTFNSGNYWIDVSFIIPDTVAPTVTGRSPGVEAVDVDPAADVVVTFSEPVDPGTVTSATVRLRAVGAATDVPATVSTVGNVVMLDPVAPLSSNVRYTVTVEATVSDLAGNPLGADASWSFTVVNLCAAEVPGALGWWPGAGNLVAEVGPNLIGTVGFETGKVGQGLAFDGTNAISVDAFPPVDTAVSVEMWVKPLDTGFPARVQTLVSRWDFPSTDDSARSYALVLDPFGSLVWMTDETSTRRPVELSAPASQLFDGTFHHVAATWDQSQITLYVDGVQVASTASQRGTLNPAASTSVRLGSKNGLGDRFFFNGVIDEPAIYGRAVTAAEVAALHSAGADGACRPG